MTQHNNYCQERQGNRSTQTCKPLKPIHTVKKVQVEVNLKQSKEKFQHYK